VRKAYSYVRFSTPEQLKGDSLRRQTKLSADYCAKHKLLLDESLNLRDLGVSAYRGKNAATGALASFLDAVKQERVPKGSVLIIENLDRLTRDEIGEALSLFISILNAGIHIATLSPEVEYTKKSINEIGVILQAVLQLFLGHEESSKKSGRLSQAWDAKRATLAARKLTGKCPFWLTLSPDRSRFVVHADRVKTVKTLFELSRQGHGATAISRIMNAAGVLSPYRKAWNGVSVLAILRSRAVIGEFTPHRGGPGSRAPIGTPIPNYYPRIIPEAEFYAAQATIAGRKNQRGPRGKGVRNLFTGLVEDARDQTPMHIIEKRPGDFRMVSSGAMRGQKDTRYVSFPYAVFERAVLTMLREVDPRAITDQEGGDDMAALDGELLQIVAKKGELERELLTGESAVIAKVLRQVEARERELAERLAQAREEAATPVSEAWGETQTLLTALDKARDRDEARLRLRAMLRRVVKEIQVLIVPIGNDRVAAAQVWFAGGDKRREYLIGEPAADGEPSVRSLSGAVKPGALDLRNRDHAAELEKALLAAV
jgi:DNA invertase Pin-like site-specific DNA recombinase